MKAFYVVVQWLLTIVIIVAIWYVFKCIMPWFTGLKLTPLNGFTAVLFSLAIAVFWVNKLQWFRNTKPFNCVGCLCGWLSLLLAWLFAVPNFGFYLFTGWLIGMIFDNLMNKYL